MIFYEVFDVNHKDTVLLTPASIYALVPANHDKYGTEEQPKLPFETEIRAGQLTVFSGKTVAQIRTELEEIEEAAMSEILKKELAAAAEIEKSLDLP